MNIKNFLVLGLVNIILFTSSMAFSQSSLERIEKDVFVLASDSLMGRGAGTIYGDRAAQYIFLRFKENGMDPKYQNIKVGTTEKNIYAVIEGSDPKLKNEFIIMGAHYDHLGYKTEKKAGKLDTIIYNGADDNASGSALILELGRLISQNRENFKRSVVIIAFDSEETGLNGSYFFANSNEAYNGVIIADNTKLMMSLDMVGWLKQSNNLQITGVGMLNNYTQYFANVGASGVNRVKFKNFSRSIFTGSDHQPFINRNIPALHITTGTKSPYHKPEDDADLIDCQGINSITNYFYQVVNNLANADKVGHSGKNPALKDKVGPNYFGIEIGAGNNQHNYKKGNMTGKPDFAYKAGVFGNFTLNNYFAIKTGIDYNYLGAKRYETRVKSHSISVPLNLLIRLGTPDNDFSFSVGAGLFYEYIFDSRATVNNIKEKNYLNQNNYGLGTEFEIRIMKYIIGFNTRAGLSNILNDPNFGKTNQITTTFKIGYIF